MNSSTTLPKKPAMPLTAPAALTVPMPQTTPTSRTPLALAARAAGFAAALGLLASLPAAATCGGGGGGGQGGIGMGGGPVGMRGAAGSSRGAGGNTYHSPWSVVHAGDEVPAPVAAPAGAPVDSLVLYWFPTSAKEAKASDLQASRDLTLATTRCVALALVPDDNHDLRSRFAGDATAASAASVVLADSSGKVLGRVAADAAGKLKAAQVEKLVSTELKNREAAASHTLDTARDRERQGDAAGATDLYGQVWAARCLVPGSVPDKAAQALKKLGHPVAADAAQRPAPPRLGNPDGQRIQRIMQAGLAAEDAAQYRRAATLYARAASLDAADPVPLRYLGELERHHLGDWTAARRTFGRILAMPADPVSRAAALHGLGKMTIHDGDFAHGLALIEQSIAAWPLPLAYRNLAVYWNSEGQVDKARGFAEKALALDPDDTYTQIFVAAFVAEDGRRDEALRIAHANEDLLAASYNLAAIHCLLGHRDQALALLRRHFYSYERYDAVRSKEMKEAREDIVFTALKQDPEFLALTALAEVAAVPKASKPPANGAAGAATPTAPMPGAAAATAPQAGSGVPR